MNSVALLLLVFVILAGCTPPLQEQLIIRDSDTTGEAAGKVAARVLLAL